MANYIQLIDKTTNEPDLKSVKTPEYKFLGTESCPKCGAWNAKSWWRTNEGIEFSRFEGCRCSSSEEQ